MSRLLVLLAMMLSGCGSDLVASHWRATNLVYYADHEFGICWARAGGGGVGRPGFGLRADSPGSTGAVFPGRGAIGG